jgi:hypothetical protein
VLVSTSHAKFTDTVPQDHLSKVNSSVRHAVAAQVLIFDVHLFRKSPDVVHRIKVTLGTLCALGRPRNLRICIAAYFRDNEFVGEWPKCNRHTVASDTPTPNRVSSGFASAMDSGAMLDEVHSNYLPVKPVNSGGLGDGSTHKFPAAVHGSISNVRGL